MNHFKNSPFQRFGLFAIINTLHYGWYYLFVTIGIVFSVVGLTYIQLYAQPGIMKQTLEMAYWYLINIGIANITASGFSIYRKNSAKIHLLTLPVSNLMKLLSVILFTTVIPFILITAVYSLLANGIAAFCSANDFTDAFKFTPLWTNEAGSFSEWFSHVTNFFVFQSFLLMVGSFFPRAGVIKAALSIAALIILVFIIDALSATFSMDTTIFWNFFNLANSNSNSSTMLLAELPQNFIFMIKALGIAIIPFAYALVYLRIKELEV